MSLSDILTTENLDSYARVCRDMGMELWVQQMSGKYGHLLMPSRGALPLLSLARMALDLELRKPFKPFDDGYIKEKYSIPSLTEIWLPYTAYAPDEGITTASQRLHWCKVLKGILTAKETPEFLLHKVFTSNICKQRFDRTEAHPTRPKGLIIVDTVISGRAVVEISAALESIGITDYYMLLAVEQNGTKMKPQYKSQIDRLIAEGKAKLFGMNHIFTEDSHPGLTGITSVVFPEITAGLQSIAPNGASVGFWHIEVARRPDGMNLPYTVTNAIINTAIYRRIRYLSGSDDGLFEDYMSRSDREELFKLEDEGRLESRDLVREFIEPVLQKGDLKDHITDIDISSSFIVAVHLDKEFVDRTLTRFRPILG